MRHSSLFCKEQTIFASSASRSMLPMNALMPLGAEVVGVMSGAEPAALVMDAEEAVFFFSADCDMRGAGT